MLLGSLPYQSEKEGPTIGYLAEYDALPGLGHACGHNIIGTASVLAGIALKQVIDHVGGKVVVLGMSCRRRWRKWKCKSFICKSRCD